MEVKYLLKTKLLQYLSNEISKEKLYKWAVDLLHKMLKGDIFDRSHLEIWGIVTQLTGLSDIDDSYCYEQVHQFSKILSGDECASFVFAIQIPKKFVVNNLSQIKSILQKYLVNKQLSESEILKLEAITQRPINKINTLNEILESHIADLLKLGYNYFSEEGSVIFDLKSTVFISEVESISLEDTFLAEIIKLLECYDGNKCFYVHTNFINGIGNISIHA